MSLTADAVHTLFEHIPACVALIDRDLRFVFVSRRYMRDYHAAPDGETVAGRHVYEVFPNAPMHLRQCHQRVLSGQAVPSHIVNYTRADGQVDWIRYEAAPWCDPAGRVIGIQTFSEVLTRPASVVRMAHAAPPRESPSRQVTAALETLRRMLSTHNAVVGAALASAAVLSS